MATLSKIRSHGVLLLVIVGLAMLAFILGDFLHSGSTFFHRNRENAAVISGNKVNIQDFDNTRKQLEETYKMQNLNVSDNAVQQQIRNQVWEWFLLENTFGEEAETIGLNVTAEEQNAQIRSIVYQIKQSIKNPELANAYIYNPSYWACWEREARLGLLQQKYYSLLNSLVRANSLDAKFAFNARQADVNVEYAFKPYYAIPDSLVSVSNADIKALYNLHKEGFKQEPYRVISYVTFDIVPSEADYKDVEKFMKNLQEEFNTTDDIASLVNSNSNIPFSGIDYSEETIPAQYKDFAFAKNAKAGQVTELLFDNNTYSMARIVKAGYSLPDSIELRFIATEEGQEDQTGWVKVSDMNQEFAESALNCKKGARFTTNSGNQTYEVLDISKATPKVQLAILERTVNPSSNTNTAIYNKVNQFIIENGTEEKFMATVKEQDLNLLTDYKLTKTTENIGTLKEARQIVKWAFTAKEGEISNFKCDDKYVVALLTKANDNKYRSIDEVKNTLIAEAINDKKAELILRDAKDVQTLEEAAKLFGTEIQTAEHINLSSIQFGNSGPELAVIGTAMTMADNTVSEPIKGNLGVYVIKTGVKVIANNEIDLEAEKKQLTQRSAYMVLQQFTRPILNNAKITDNRINFY